MDVRAVSPAEIRARAEEHLAGGRWHESHAAYCELFEIAVRLRDIVMIVRALIAEAYVLHCWGRSEPAEELGEMALAVAGAHALIREQSRALNMLGTMRHRFEDWDGARRLYMEALELARSVWDEELIAGTCQNLGVVATASGDPREARALYLEAICATVRAENPRLAGTTYNNLGMVCSDLNDWMEAEIHFLRGLEIAERLEDLPLLALISTGRAEPLIHTGEFDAAEATLDRAETFGLQLDDRVVLADASRYRGMIARLRGDFAEASEHLARAAQIAKESSLELEQAEVLEETARLRRAEGRNAAAMVVLREALRSYERLGAKSDVARVESTMQKWSGRAEETLRPIASAG